MTFRGSILIALATLGRSLLFFAITFFDNLILEQYLLIESFMKQTRSYEITTMLYKMRRTVLIMQIKPIYELKVVSSIIFPPKAIRMQHMKYRKVSLTRCCWLIIVSCHYFSVRSRAPIIKQVNQSRQRLWCKYYVMQTIRSEQRIRRMIKVTKCTIATLCGWFLLRPQNSVLQAKGIYTLSARAYRWCASRSISSLLQIDRCYPPS